MGGIWGTNIKISIFGESHGRAIGVVIDGLPPGIQLDMDYINHQMERRRPGKRDITTSRKETDRVEILSGYFNNRTTGTPLAVMIENTNQNSLDYESMKNVMRPSHGDYPGNIKYRGFNDYRGGGHFSGRLTAPIVFVGTVARQILKAKGIIVGSHIKAIENMQDDCFDMTNIEHNQLEALGKMDFPLLDESKENVMRDIILRAKEEKDSVGGLIETAIINVPPGIGEPFFDSVESKISQLAFSVPGVKAIEFGRGFEISKLRGSQAKDEYYWDDDKVRTYTNNNGGVLGGITTGMPIVFTVAIKPTPSITKEQRTINIETGQNMGIEISGRHDPCILPRAVPVIESIAAISILDLMMGRKEW